MWEQYGILESKTYMYIHTSRQLEQGTVLYLLDLCTTQFLTHQGMVNVVFLHPDLGIGGAERLVVDAALALRSKGCNIQIWTAHYDPDHCFSETKDSGIPIVCVGDWLPRSILGYFHAVCAYIRMIYVTWYLIFLSGVEFEVVFCDQVSACIPVLRFARRRKKVLFYCHFPDQLLAERKTAIKQLYRAPLDYLEELTTGMADCIVVNSQFTAGVFKHTFKSLSALQVDVLYPSLNFTIFDTRPNDLEGLIPEHKKIVFLSINRYERKKNLPLALEALNQLHSKISADEWQKVHLVMAGGYDDRVLENVEHYKELKALSDTLGLADHVTYLRSFSDTQKISLLHNCSCVLYTPSNEHFGIVPLEAMYTRCPVIAVNSGGPLESIADGETGFLCDPQPKLFAEAMEKFVKDPILKKKMGEAGRQQVLKLFSPEAFATQLYHYVCKLSE
ncbi:alpha-1,3/1,6-mannosyltransferase ALG2 isoform X1 [Erpetoichthys calabaricus]|uniref:alpha-1,3/1,6-mannosyltransferase ALG2 isoform X1 n=2 Tax=Erpetoichthys calabaricus TaxID=27687 RepID=UPI0022347C9B|nr:alpha-1,3/1,6-mannosyltransferase ALG2 isoform X1 [Erpetoichthys calabaricus]